MLMQDLALVESHFCTLQEMVVSVEDTTQWTNVPITRLSPCSPRRVPSSPLLDRLQVSTPKWGQISPAADSRTCSLSRHSSRLLSVGSLKLSRLTLPGYSTAAGVDTPT